VIISSSKINRAYNTGKIILSYLNILFNSEFKLLENDNLLRWDSKNETKEDVKNRAFEYGKRVSKKINNSDNVNIYIFFTHSSIISSFISGIINKDIHIKHLVNASVNIIKNNKYDIQNIKIR